MLGKLFRSDPRRDLTRRYEAALRAARDLQRAGDVVAAAAKTSEADELRRALEALDRQASR
ncbi:MAG: hypothetical protein IPM29_07105 [Planctomycetes bacterium]|nr:hypothetical protein [Planctomycetota bacterium]